MLTIVWHIIAEGKTYQEIGGDYYDRLHPERSARRLIRRLEQLGFEVDAKWKAPPPQQSVTPAAPLLPTDGFTDTSNEGTRHDVPHKSKPAPKAADPATCRKCARWGIECIHARNAKPRASVPAPSAESVT
jgi:hypothetical protein